MLFCPAEWKQEASGDEVVIQHGLFIYRYWTLCLILLIGFPFCLADASQPHFDPAIYLGNSGYRAQRDSTVTYRADSMHMEVPARLSLLIGSGELGFQNMSLQSPNILLDWRHDLVEAWISEEEILRDRARADSLQRAEAEGELEDTAEADSLQTARDTTFVGGSTVTFNTDYIAAMQRESHAESSVPMHRRDTGLENWPAFQDGTQELVGRKMSLNIRTKQGRISEGRTSDNEGLYYGLRIKRVYPGELHASDAGFTTCDDPHPHYCFRAKRLKMLVKDRILARDVQLYFGEVPTLYAPVAVFNLRRGRASGLIVPSYGAGDREGRKLSHLGWYWAASDYWDTKATIDFAENGPDWLFYNYTRWKTDSNNSGRLSYSYGITRTSNETGWDLRWHHNQKLNPWTSLAADVRMASSRSYYQNNSDNLENQLTRALSSSATLNGSFPQQRISWRLAASASQDLETDYVSGNLPSLSLNFPNTNPFSVDEDTDPGALREWLAGAVVTYKMTGRNKFNGQSWNLAEAEHESGLQHTSRLSIPGRLGYLSLSPSVSASSDWLFETQDLVRRSNGDLDTLTANGLAIRNTFSASLSSSTDLYGTVYSRRGPLLALRHVVSPSVQLTWAPDFSKDFWGYFDSEQYSDTSGQIQTATLDRFSGSLYGNTSTRDALKLSMSLAQVFQGKFRGQAETDTITGVSSSEALRMDLLGLNSSSSYNFRAESFRLADLSTSWRVDPLRLVSDQLGFIRTFNITLSTRNSFYKVDEEGNRINRYRWQEGPGPEVYWPRLTNTSISLSTSLNGKAKSGSFNTETESDDEWEDDARFRPDFLSGPSDIPWNISLSINWSRNTANPLNVTRTHTASASGGLSLSDGWRISSGINYNFITDEFNANSLRVYRDMHCWEGSFVWNPRNSNPSFRLIINVKASALQDLKWDKKRGTSQIYRP